MMMHENINEDGSLEPRFLEKSYGEAMELTQAVASYLEVENKKFKGDRLRGEGEVHYASESMRVSTCLMQVMSWFLVQKGVAAGEITRTEAGNMKFRLGAGDICLAHVDTSMGGLPEIFIEYLDKSQNLYRQVARMDKMLYGDHVTVNSVHQMFRQIINEDAS